MTRLPPPGMRRRLTPSEAKEVIVAGTLWAILMAISVGLLNYFHINPVDWVGAGICCGNFAIAVFVGEALRHWFWEKFLKEPSGKAPPPAGQDQSPSQYRPPPHPAPGTAQVRTCKHCNGPMDPDSSYCPVCHRKN